MEARPWLAREEDKSSNTPMHLAVRWHKIDVLSVLLEHDRSLGYQVSTLGNPLLVSAAYRGHVGVARELLKHCPDAPCYNTRGSTCLHIAVQFQQTEFVKFVLGLPQFQKLVNMRDENGDTALHVAVQKCDPKMVAALLLHRDIDITVVNNNGCPVNRTLPTDRAKTLNWVRMFSLTLVHKSVCMPIICNVMFSYHPYALLEFSMSFASIISCYTS
jgi:ankyrin repeat protein